MEIQRQEVVFVVHQGRGGWLVDGPMSIGPFHSKQHAADLADGMAKAIQAAGQRARVEMKS